MDEGTTNWCLCLSLKSIKRSLKKIIGSYVWLLSLKVKILEGSSHRDVPHFCGFYRRKLSLLSQQRGEEQEPFRKIPEHFLLNKVHYSQEKLFTSAQPTRILPEINPPKVSEILNSKPLWPPCSSEGVQEVLICMWVIHTPVAEVHCESKT